MLPLDDGHVVTVLWIRDKISLYRTLCYVFIILWLKYWLLLFLHILSEYDTFGLLLYSIIYFCNCFYLNADEWVQFSIYICIYVHIHWVYTLTTSLGLGSFVNCFSPIYCWEGERLSPCCIHDCMTGFDGVCSLPHFTWRFCTSGREKAIILIFVFGTVNCKFSYFIELCLLFSFFVSVSYGKINIFLKDMLYRRLGYLEFVNRMIWKIWWWAR